MGERLIERYTTEFGVFFIAMLIINITQFPVWAGFLISLLLTSVLVLAEMVYEELYIRTVPSHVEKRDKIEFVEVKDTRNILIINPFTRRVTFSKLPEEDVRIKFLESHPYLSIILSIAKILGFSAVLFLTATVSSYFAYLSIAILLTFIDYVYKEKLL